MLKEIHLLGYSWLFFMNTLCQISANQRPTTPNEPSHHQILNIISVQCTWTKISHKKFHNYNTNWTEHEVGVSLGSKGNTGEAGNFSPRCYRGNNRKQNSRKKINNVFLEQKSAKESDGETELKLLSFLHNRKGGSELAVCVLWMRSYFHWMDLLAKFHSKTFQNLQQMTGSSQNKDKARIISHFCESN